MTTTLSSADHHRISEHLDRAVEALKSLQHEDGHWRAELEGDSILESEYLLMKFILGQEHEPMADGRPADDVLPMIAAGLRRQQRDDGGWGQFPGSGVDLSATVKAYFALKLVGDDPDAPHMRKARECVLQSGGAEKCNSFTNFYLACLGQVSWNAVPAIPPEIAFLPRSFYFHMTKVSAWTRTMILPLSLVVTLRPMRSLPASRGIDELYLNQLERHQLNSKPDTPPAWNRFFLTVDRALKIAHHLGGTPVRRLAIKRCEEWIIERAGQDGTGTTEGLGAIFPPMVYQQIAFHALGYKRDHAVIQRAERELDDFFLDKSDGECAWIKIQPCFSPVWDTGIALYALTDCGLDINDPAVQKSADWLVSKECKHIGDWIDNLRMQDKTRFRSASREPGFGWYFEYNNAWYPDCDDTAMVAMALKRAGGTNNIDAAHRGIEWLFAMQNDDGGWAAFDRTKHRQILEYIPFADHNAMQDPSCPDITGRVLECLAWHGYDRTHPAVRKAIAYIRSQQIVWMEDAMSSQHERANNSDQPQAAYGCWFGRWGVNYIYGTWQAVIGPIRCGEDPSQDWIQRAGRWIKSIQSEDGSFGETAMSYEDPSQRGTGSATASQTAWAAMILQEIFGADDANLKRAIDWLCKTQLSEDDARDLEKNPDGDPAGSWHEPWYTGTGFPKVFYLRYHLYRLYFPVMAIGRFLAARGGRTLKPAREAAVKQQPIGVGA